MVGGLRGDGPMKVALPRVVPMVGPIDLRATLAPLRRGPYDPCLALGHREVWRATHTPDGPGTQRLTVVDGGIETEAFGPGAAWLLDHAAALVGSSDTGADFRPASGPVA